MKGFSLLCQCNTENTSWIFKLRNFHEADARDSSASDRLLCRPQWSAKARRIFRDQIVFPDVGGALGAAGRPCYSRAVNSPYSSFFRRGRGLPLFFLLYPWKECGRLVSGERLDEQRGSPLSVGTTGPFFSTLKWVRARRTRHGERAI